MDLIWKSASGCERTTEEMAERAASLPKRDVRILGLMSAGLRDGFIGKVLDKAAETVKQRIHREIKPALGLMGRGREVIALAYVHFLLPTDLLGSPADRSKRVYTEPGEKLADWQMAAARTRLTLYDRGVLTPYGILIAQGLADPETADLGDAETAERLPQLGKNPPTRFTVHDHRARMTGCMKNGSRVKLSVITTLAPFNQIPTRV